MKKTEKLIVEKSADGNWVLVHAPSCLVCRRDPSQAKIRSYRRAMLQIMPSDFWEPPPPDCKDIQAFYRPFARYLPRVSDLAGIFDRFNVHVLEPDPYNLTAGLDYIREDKRPTVQNGHKRVHVIRWRNNTLLGTLVLTAARNQPSWTVSSPERSTVFANYLKVTLTDGTVAETAMSLKDARKFAIDWLTALNPEAPA